MDAPIPGECDRSKKPEKRQPVRQTTKITKTFFMR